MHLIKWTETLLVVALFSLGTATFQAHAAETTKEKAAEAARDTKKNTKKVYREVKDEVCEMVNGKMECVGQKIKHKTQNAVDEVKDKADGD